MTERKPKNISWQSWIERQISEGQLGGAFDDLGGQGRPIKDLGVVHDEMWWVKAKLRDEDIEYLPPTIAIRAERATAIEEAMRSPSKASALRIIENVNARIRYINSHSAHGPPSTAVAIDLDSFVERWRAAHPADEALSPADAAAIGVAARPARWWHQFIPWNRPGRDGGESDDQLSSGSS